MKTYLDLLKILPKTNCKECGLESCLLFALKVFSREISPEKCPYLDLKKLPFEFSSSSLTFNQLLENLKFLKGKFKEVNLLERAPQLGGHVDFEKRIVLIPYMDKNIVITLTEEGYPLEIVKDRSSLDPRDEILLCNYFIFNGREALSEDFAGLEAFPHSLSKVKTLKLYAEAPLAEFINSCREGFSQLLNGFRIEAYEESSSGLSFTVWALPRVPMKVVFWAGDEEEGLSPSCKILYNKKALSYLDLECLVFCAERFYEILQERAKGL